MQLHELSVLSFNFPSATSSTSQPLLWSQAPVELCPGDVADLGHGCLAALAEDAAPVEVVAHVQQVVRIVGLSTTHHGSRVVAGCVGAWGC